MHMPDKPDASDADGMFTGEEPLELQCRKAQMGMIILLYLILVSVTEIMIHSKKIWPDKLDARQNVKNEENEFEMKLKTK